MTRTFAVWVAVLAACLCSYTIGLTVGYGGCVAQAGEIFTNNLLRGM